MPFTSEQLSYGGRAAIDFYFKNEPIDQVNVERPWIKKLMATKKPYVGGLQYVVEQLRRSNDSNFQSFFGDTQVTYNRKRTLQQAKFTWGAFHDGFGLNEDELVQNGITMTEDKAAVPTTAEKVQLNNLLKENTDTLRLGFQQNFDYMLHRDGSQSATDIPGLDSLISTTPTTSAVIGGLDQSVYTWWQNTAITGINTGTAGTLTDQMEIAWRDCTRYGGFAPDLILCGEAFLDAYRKDATSTVNRTVFVKPDGGSVDMDAGIGEGTDWGLTFKNRPLVWDPVMTELDTLDNPTIPWEKRCYFINTKFINLRPIQGHWMVPRTPPRVYDRYVHYWALTARAALTTGKRNAHAVLSIA
ncbi:MAG: phage major capsid protein [Patescibacteria group bacterium]|nr:phage major capsid protein [Patescibacteria group bacterium]